MTKKELRSYLDKAVVITKRQRHDEYSWAPCYVEAIVNMDGTKIKVKIWAGILGELVYPDGKKVLVADKTQADKPE